MEQAVERGLDWVGAAYSTPILARPRSPHRKSSSGVNAGARIATGALSRAVRTSDHRPSPCIRSRMVPLHWPSICRRTGPHPFRAAPMSYWTSRGTSSLKLSACTAGCAHRRQQGLCRCRACPRAWPRLTRILRAVSPGKQVTHCRRRDR